MNEGSETFRALCGTGTVKQIALRYVASFSKRQFNKKYLNSRVTVEQDGRDLEV